MEGHIPWLCNIRMHITNNPELLKKILHYIHATVVLHDMLIEIRADDQNDEDVVEY